MTETCAACGSGLAAAFAGKGYAVIGCKRCGLRRIDPIPSPAALSDYYSRWYALAADAAHVASEGYREQSDHVVQLLTHWAPAARRVCEIGCSAGWLLQDLQRHGYDVKGYELSAATSQLARDRGLDVETGEFTADGDRFDVILMRHVLEHTRDPLGQLQHAAARLNEGGTLLVAVPNGASLCSRLLGRYWSWYIPPAHIWYLTPESLRTLAQRAGLAPLWIATRQGDADHPCVELAAGVARRFRRAPAVADASFVASEPEALTQRRPGRALIRTASRALQPISAAISAVGFGDELWMVARKAG
jgi:SAM-dependent methyltransferase